jgi:hypothetical protein
MEEITIGIHFLGGIDMSKSVNYINTAIVGDFERGYYVSKDDAIIAVEIERTELLDKIERVINNVLSGYVIRNFHFGDSYSIDKLAKDIRKEMEE